MKTILTAALAATLLAGCASQRIIPQYRPLIDASRTNIDTSRYELDLSQCQLMAADRSSVASGAVGGALVGALFGAVIASAMGAGNYGGQVAGFGAVTAGAHGAVKAEQNQHNIIRNCMTGRGYAVLD